MENGLTRNEIDALRAELAGLPRGSVTTKTIKGRKRFYLQWAEGGTTKSRYLSADEVAPMRKTVERRRELVKILRDYPAAAVVSSRRQGNISVVRGETLARWARTAAA